MGDAATMGQASRADDAVLELRGVCKQFVVAKRTIEALRNVTLGVQRGRVTGLIGPDGAGKTTLMRLAVGLLVPDKGLCVLYCPPPDFSIHF